jgi:hypothetical protein
MSNTHHHRNQKNRHIGQDLWSKRPMSGCPYEASFKAMSRRIERNGKDTMKLIKEELDGIL